MMLSNLAAKLGSAKSKSAAEVLWATQDSPTKPYSLEVFIKPMGFTVIMRYESCWNEEAVMGPQLEVLTGVNQEDKDNIVSIG